MQNDFRTPDEVAAMDDVGSPTPDTLTPTTPSPSPTPAPDTPKTGKLAAMWQKLDLHWPPGRKEYLVAAGVILVLGGVTAFALTRDSKPVPKPVVKKMVKKPVVPKTVPSTLTGLQIDPSVNLRPVTGIMIENSQDARPQSGLSEAGVVFEAIAEGGITRFLTLFQDTAPEDIGPIRSARPYYISWLMAFDAGYAHVGGSPEALANIKALGVRDLDQFANAGSYHRVNSRAAPHNVYTSIAALNQLETAKGYGTSTFTGFVRKKVVPAKKTSSIKPAAAAPAPTARTIDLSISGPVYGVHYDYNAPTNSYNRSEGGAPHIDVNGNRVISPTVVVGLVVPFSIASDGRHSVYQVVGSGAAYVFQDGNVTIGTWTKPGDKNQITFTDATGKPLGLNPGQTWITAVSDASKVTYAP